MARVALLAVLLGALLLWVVLSSTSAPRTPAPVSAPETTSRVSPHSAVPSAQPHTRDLVLPPATSAPRRSAQPVTLHGTVYVYGNLWTKKEVRVLRIADLEGNQSPLRNPRTVLTDSLGQFTVSKSLLPGIYEIYITFPGKDRWFRALPGAYRLLPGLETEIVACVDPPALELQLLDRDSGAPVPSACLVLATSLEPTGLWWAFRRTNSAGMTRLRLDADMCPRSYYVLKLDSPDPEIVQQWGLRHSWLARTARSGRSNPTLDRRYIWDHLVVVAEVQVHYMNQRVTLRLD